MISSESRRDWMHRFGSRLMKLEPSMNVVTAAAHAAAAYEEHANDAIPEDAASAFATGKSGGEPGAPDQGRDQGSSGSRLAMSKRTLAPQEKKMGTA